jgi:hypothetical protein
MKFTLLFALAALLYQALIYFRFVPLLFPFLPLSPSSIGRLMTRPERREPTDARPDYDLLPTMLTNLLGGSLSPPVSILPPSSSASAATAVQAVATTVTKAVGATMTMPTVRSVTATI